MHSFYCLYFVGCTYENFITIHAFHLPSVSGEGLLWNTRASDFIPSSKDVSLHVRAQGGVSNPERPTTWFLPKEFII